MAAAPSSVCVPPLLLCQFLPSSLKLTSCRVSHGFVCLTLHFSSLIFGSDHSDCRVLVLPPLGRCLVPHGMASCLTLELRPALGSWASSGEGTWCCGRDISAMQNSLPPSAWLQDLCLEQITYFHCFSSFCDERTGWGLSGTDRGSA